MHEASILYKNIVENNFPLSLKFFVLECIRMLALTVLILFFISLSEIVSNFVQAARVFQTNIFWILPGKNISKYRKDIFLQKKNPKPNQPINPIELSALSLKPRIKIPPMAAVNILIRMWYLIPCLTPVRGPLNPLKQGIKTPICNLFHAYLDWFNNFWPDSSFCQEIILTVTNLIWKPNFFLQLEPIPYSWLCNNPCWLLASSNNLPAASHLR